MLKKQYFLLFILQVAPPQKCSWGNSLPQGGALEARMSGGIREALNWKEPAEMKVSWTGPVETKVSGLWGGLCELLGRSGL